MPVFQLDERLLFPPVDFAEDGLLAVGGDLSPERLLLAYSSGIFPWYEEDLPILWHSPDPRMVLPADELHVSKSLAKVMRRRPFRLEMDTDFRRVVDRCAEVPRPEQDGTWITEEMKDAYSKLHELGYAHSIEAWKDGRLAGGLYGVSIGACFFGESMFAQEPDASKVAFVAAVEQMKAWGITLIDCQVFTPHLARFGAREWSRERYLSALEDALTHRTRAKRWRLDDPGERASG